MANLPSVIRGVEAARSWKELAPENGNASSIDANEDNPLRAYFESVEKGRGIWKWRHYFDIYHRHLQKFVGRPVNVAEIGVFSGGSLGMWKSYFGPQAWVYGIDLEPDCKVYEDDRTKIFIGDQSDRKFWKCFRNEVPNLDVVIDDGGHLPEQQIVTLEETLPYLRHGGVYLCEDVQGDHNRFGAYVYGFTDALNSFALMEREKSERVEGLVACSALQRSVCSVHRYPFVTVVEKSARPPENLVSERRGTEWQPFFKRQQGFD